MQLRESVEDTVKQIDLQVRPELEAVKDKLVAVNESVVGFVKAHPAKCLLGALALGYLAGRIARGGSWLGHGKD